jgi:hypothetical protein
MRGASFTLWPLYSRGNNPRYILDRNMATPQKRSAQFSNGNFHMKESFIIFSSLHQFNSSFKSFNNLQKRATAADGRSLTLVPQFHTLEWGLIHRLAVYDSVSIYPSSLRRLMRLSCCECVPRFSFCMWSVPYQSNADDWIFPELIAIVATQHQRFSCECVGAFQHGRAGCS